MTNTVTINDKNIATVDMTIAGDVAKEFYDRTLKAYGQNVNIAGFRKGKAPVGVIEKYVGIERIKAEVIDRLFPSEFQKVIEENKLNIAFRPTIENVEFNLGSDLKIQAMVELKPEVKIGSYKDTEVTYEEYKTPADALEKELEMTRRRFSKLEKVEKASTDKDTVVFDFEGFVGEEKIEHGEGKNYTLDLANSNFIPGFAEGLVGHKAGEEFDIKVKFPADYHEEKLKGADATFKIKLHEVKERTLPELDDELAKKAGKDSLDALKEDIKKYLEGMEKSQNDRLKSDAIFAKVVETTEIKIQDTMLDREYEAIMQDARISANQQGANFDELVEKEGKENVEKRFREEAEKRIKNSLIIEKIAQDEQVKVEQSDVMNHINQMAAMYGMPPVQLFEELRKNPESFAAISQQITANKVNDFLLEHNTFKAK